MNRAKLGVSEELPSYDIAVVGDCLVEGHVPADTIRRLLRERPRAAGIAIAVPGMPRSAPGMDQPSLLYNVMIFRKRGDFKVHEKR